LERLLFEDTPRQRGHRAAVPGEPGKIRLEGTNCQGAEQLAEEVGQGGKLLGQPPGGIADVSDLEVSVRPHSRVPRRPLCPAPPALAGSSPRALRRMAGRLAV